MVGRFLKGMMAAGLLVLGAQAQDVRLNATVDSTSVRIGEWINLHVTAELSPGVNLIAPSLRDSLGAFEVLHAETEGPQPDGDARTQSWDIRLTSFDPVEGAIPPVDFAYTTIDDSLPRVASTEPIQVSVRGIEVDPGADIKDVKPPLTPPWAFEDFLPYGIFLLILAAAGAGYYYYRRRKLMKTRPVQVVPQIPPHEQALFALRSLEQKRLWQQGKVKEFYSEVTEIIRKFFEGRFGIVALEMTSDEILAQMKRIPEAGAHAKDMNIFFLTADLVKFAKYEASPAEHENELKSAFAMVRAMVPRAPSPVEQPEEATADVR